MAGDVIRISVDDVPARQRLAYLHDFVASQIAGLEFEPKDAGAFSFELLTARLDSLHDAHHAAMDCLGEMLWESQRSGRPPDGNAYIAAVQRRATRD